VRQDGRVGRPVENVVFDFDSPANDDDPPWRRGVVAVIRRGDRFLVIRRSATVAAPLKLCFPGGGLESGESEETALIRELEEELALRVRPLRPLWRCRTAWRVDLAWWAAELISDPESVRPDMAEVADVYWMTQPEMLSAPDMLSSNLGFLERFQLDQFF